MIYAKPEVDVILYENVDIVTLSGGSPIVPVDPSDPDFPPVQPGCQTAINVFKECDSTTSWKVIR